VINLSSICYLKLHTYVAAFHGLLAILGIGFCEGEKLRLDFDILMSGVNASIKIVLY